METACIQIFQKRKIVKEFLMESAAATNFPHCETLSARPTAHPQSTIPTRIIKVAKQFANKLSLVASGASTQMAGLVHKTQRTEKNWLTKEAMFP